MSAQVAVLAMSTRQVGRNEGRTEAYASSTASPAVAPCACVAGIVWHTPRINITMTSCLLLHIEIAVAHKSSTSLRLRPHHFPFTPLLSRLHYFVTTLISSIFAD